MASEIEWTKKAERPFDSITKNIEKRQSEKKAVEFVNKTDHVLDLLSQNPEMYKETDKKGVRKGLVNKHVSFYYRVLKNAVRLLTFWDNRRDPKKLRLR